MIRTILPGQIAVQLKIKRIAAAAARHRVIGRDRETDPVKVGVEWKHS